jgi:hypothetical protein
MPVPRRCRACRSCTACMACTACTSRYRACSRSQSLSAALSSRRRRARSALQRVAPHDGSRIASALAPRTSPPLLAPCKVAAGPPPHHRPPASGTTRLSKMSSSSAAGTATPASSSKAGPAAAGTGEVGAGGGRVLPRSHASEPLHTPTEPSWRQGGATRNPAPPLACALSPVSPVRAAACARPLTGAVGRGQHCVHEGAQRVVRRKQHRRAARRQHRGRQAAVGRTGALGLGGWR